MKERIVEITIEDEPKSKIAEEMQNADAIFVRITKNVESDALIANNKDGFKINGIDVIETNIEIDKDGMKDYKDDFASKDA